MRYPRLLPFVFLALTASLFAQSNPVPFVNQPLVPAATAPGGPGFVLTVNGSGFVPTSVVNWKAVPITTTFVSQGQLTANVPAESIAVAETASVTVTNPGPGGGTSNVLTFAVTNSTDSLTLATSSVNVELTPVGVVAADVNGDGKLDLAVFNKCGSDQNCTVCLLSRDCPNVGSVSILLGNGDGTFSAAPSLGVQGYANFGAAGDLNHDGNLDLAVISAPNCQGCAYVTFFLGHGDGTFTKSYRTEDLDGGYYGVILGDFDQDGNLDFAAPASVGLGPPQVYVLLGNGDGTFRTSPGILPFFFLTGGAATGDFNRDWILDLVVMDSHSALGFDIALGNGDGTFGTSSATSPLLAPERPPISLSRSMTAADFNGDGLLDLAFIDRLAMSLKVFLGSGDGTFTERGSLAVSQDLASINIADLNGDEKLDLAVVDGDAIFSLYLGNGDGTFQSALRPNIGNMPSGLAIGDFNGDGRLDLVTANPEDNTISISLQAAGASLSPTALSFGNQVVGSTSSPLQVTLSNTGSAPMTVSSARTTGNFQIQANSCMDGLRPGSNCHVDVSFVPTAVGNRTGTLTFDDNATNSPQTVSLSGVGTTAEESSTILNSSLNPSRYGQTITLTAVVVPGGTDTPTGNVTFYDGTSPLASVPLNNGVATLSISTLIAGNHSMTASYAGDGIFGPSTSGVLVQTVAKASVGITLISSLNPAYVNQLVTFSVAVSGNPGTPTGSATFKKGVSVLATVPLANGRASFTTAFTKAGSFSIVASYSGDQNYLAKNSKAVKQVVKKYATSIALTSSPNPSLHGQPVTFTATVTSTGPMPTGKVVLKNGCTSLGSAALINGVAKKTTSILPVGTNSITATYNGDVESAKSTSPVLTQVVN